MPSTWLHKELQLLRIQNNTAFYTAFYSYAEESVAAGCDSPAYRIQQRSTTSTTSAANTVIHKKLEHVGIRTFRFHHVLCTAFTWSQVGLDQCAYSAIGVIGLCRSAAQEKFPPVQNSCVSPSPNAYTVVSPGPQRCPQVARFAFHVCVFSLLLQKHLHIR